MDTNLYGKFALVCGSSRGIGKASAIQLASMGASVTLVSRSPDKMADVIKEMDMNIEKGQDHDFLVADFTDQADLIKKIKGLALTKTYHVLVNNTGGPKGGAIVDASTKEFLEAFNNHLICNHILTTHLIDGMKREGFGRIINVISVSVKTPIQNLGVSNTTRGAVASWAKTMANELGPYGITVNNVLPGYTDTERLREVLSMAAQNANTPYEAYLKRVTETIPAARIGRPEEVGAAVAFLASPAASYINGINLPVDGGRTPTL